VRHRQIFNLEGNGTMQSSTFTFTDVRGVDVFCYRWLPDGGAPRAVIQVSHGMQEHAGRYAGLAQFVTAHGYGVYANDHLGHGKTALAIDRQGILGPGGWESAVQVMKVLTDRIKTEQPGVPVFLLGHSWGSFLAQSYIERWGADLRGVVLSGTSGADPLVAIGLVLARQQVRKHGADATAGILEKISVGNLNKAFEPARTPRDWISRDTAVVDAYVADPYCGKPFPNSFFLELTRLLKETWKPANERKVPKELPIYLYSGTRDPVGKFTKTVVSLAGRYRKYGIKDVATRFYPDARHETLNETNRAEVMRDLLEWLDGHVAGHGEKG
jgi:alpha-beta hydrolase superfamily lysophospholipase